MNTYNQDLFILIKSLEHTEKRYFLSYNSKSGDVDEKNFLLLFKAINKQKEYDERKLIDEFDRKGIITRKAFSNAKVHLYNTLLKHLEIYYSDSDKHHKIYSLIQQARILKDKALHKQSEKVLLKAKAIAQGTNLPLELFHISSLQLELSTYNVTLEGQREKVEKRFMEVDNALDILVLNNKYWKLFTQYYSLYCLGTLENKGKEEEFELLMQNPLLKDETEARSYFSRNIFYTINIKYSHLNGNYEACYLFSKKSIEFMETFTERVKLSQNVYVSYLNNHLIWCFGIDKKKEFLHTVNKIRGLKYTSMLAKISAFYSIAQNELAFYIKYKEYDKALKQVKDIETGLTKFKGKYSRRIEHVIFINLSELYFLVKDFPKSIKWLNKFLQQKDAEVSTDFYKSARLFYILLLLESAEENILESQYRTTYSYFKKENWLGKFELFMFNFIKAELNGKTDKEKFRKQLKEIKMSFKDETFEKGVFGDFRFINWVEERLK
ncbi:MAG: hypothetical protein H0W84_05695 [Bacteroidetes bacterium]|nr:hypothetical protein [Bacteroidota bacterium]